MVSATGRSGGGGVSGQQGSTSGEKDQSRLLPVLAAERLLRAALLVGVGVILLTHVHADWVACPRLRGTGWVRPRSQRDRSAHLKPGKVRAASGGAGWGNRHRIRSSRRLRVTGCCVAAVG